MRGLSMQGYRVGPMDPKDKTNHLVGFRQKAHTEDDKAYVDQTLFIKSNKTGFSGGFKIPEEYKEKRMKNRKRPRSHNSDDEEKKDKDDNKITKDEILAHLNLTGGDGIGAGKAGYVIYLCASFLL